MDGHELDCLMKEVAEGDNACFERLYRETAKGVYAFAFYYLGERESAEDVMQTAFLQVKRRAYTYRGGNARAWLLQIVKNLCIDELRRRKRFRCEPEDAMSETPARESGSALDYLLGALTEEEREIVVLHVFWGYRHREIAERLSLPLGTVTWKYSAALKKLEKYEEEQG